MTNSALFEVELLQEGMDQAEIAVNEAIARIEALGQITILDRNLTAPPGGESNGDCYLVATGATGSWADKDGLIAIYQDGYTFVRPKNGWVLYIADENVYRRVRQVEYSASLSFVDSNPDTITDGGSGFVTAGFVAGMFLNVSGTVSNDNQFTIATVAAGTLTLNAGDALTAEGPVSCTLVGYDLVAVHTAEVFLHSITTVWTNMPNAVTELFGAIVNRRQFDLRGFSEFRLQARLAVVGAAAAVLRMEYSTNSGSSWANLESSGTSADLSIAAGSVIAGSWGQIAAGAKADVWLRIVGQNGDGAADPSFTTIFLQLR